MADPLTLVLSKLPDARKIGRRWRATCPAHDDPSPSLDVSVGESQPVVVICRAGCSTENVVSALGLSMSDLMTPDDSRPQSVHLDIEDRDPPVSARRKHVVARMQYQIKDASGKLVAIHARTDYSDGTKSMPWKHADGSFASPENPIAPSELPLYGSETLGHDPSTPVILVEGEKSRDVLATIWDGPIVATVTGAHHTPDRTSLSVLRGRTVLLWPDNDIVGRDHMLNVSRNLDGIASAVYGIDVPGLPEHGDAADFVEQGRTDVLTLLREAKERGRVITHPSVGTSLSGDSGGLVGGIDAADLLSLELPPLRWIVPEFLPEGTTILAAPPKIGKSTLVYQVATEVALGGTLLGRRVESGSVLYLALEDGPRRGQDRLRAALDGRAMPRDRLEVRWNAPTIGHGLEVELHEWLATHRDAALVAIDTLGRVRNGTNGKRNAYEVDVEDLGKLQNVFRATSVALVVVHHSRKEASDDFLSSVSGTFGVTGSADTIAVVRRKRLEQFGTIIVTGRDIPEAEIPVQFDGSRWLEAPQQVSAGTFAQSEVYRMIQERGPLFPAALAEMTGQTRQSVQNIVTRLAASGSIARTIKGWSVAHGPTLTVEPEVDFVNMARTVFGDDLLADDEQVH